jgi:hypothetical protein
MDPKFGLDDVEKRKFLTLQGLELRPLGRPGRRQSLCRLHYPGSQSNRSIFLSITKWYSDVISCLMDGCPFHIYVQLFLINKCLTANSEAGLVK